MLHYKMKSSEIKKIVSDEVQERSKNGAYEQALTDVRLDIQEDDCGVEYEDGKEVFRNGYSIIDRDRVVRNALSIVDKLKKDIEMLRSFEKAEPIKVDCTVADYQKYRRKKRDQKLKKLSNNNK